ncbi:MAG: hypothetical protein Q8P51_13155 [Ignavibacteria bacterium]|nr:hypothetical protein [Ignavibacteria bacterium]
MGPFEASKVRPVYEPGPTGYWLHGAKRTGTASADAQSGILQRG